VFASQTETQGLVLAEALACGLPVVALDGPGVRDSLTHGVDSVIVAKGPEGEAAGAWTAALGDAVAAVALDDERRRALASATLRSAWRADVDARLALVEELYAEVIEACRVAATSIHSNA
jgi:1,2-diacylglycerol 3-alpha-glucosyltransferase